MTYGKRSQDSTASMARLADYWTTSGLLGQIRRVVCRVEEEVSDNELRSLRDS